MPCKHSEYDCQHTTVLYGNVQCVYCLWEIMDGAQIHEISIDKMPPVDEIGWDEETAEEALNNPFGEHYKRIQEADVEYAIILCLSDQKYSILDGCHRYVKAVKILGQTTVKCMIWPES